jgi:hypothetical protein
MSTPHAESATEPSRILVGIGAPLLGLLAYAEADHAPFAASMFLVTTSIVSLSRFVGLNSTSEVPAKIDGVWPGPTKYASPPRNSSSVVVPTQALCKEPFREGGEGASDRLSDAELQPPARPRSPLAPGSSPPASRAQHVTARPAPRPSPAPGSTVGRCGRPESPPLIPTPPKADAPSWPRTDPGERSHGCPV